MRWMILLAAACGGTGSEPSSDFPPPDPLPSEFTDCDLPEDCVAVELGCCDECNGGLAVAARADRADDLVEQYTEICEEGHACTEIGCPPWVVDCVAGTCAMERGTFQR